MSHNTIRLTKSVIDKAVYGGKGNANYVLWDQDTPGFGLRIYPTGKKTFVIGYRFKNRYQQMAIGKYGILTVDQARAEAKKKLAVVASGINPAAQKKKEIECSFIHFCYEYLENHSKKQNKTDSWKEDQRRIETHLVSHFKNRDITDISRDNIAKLLHRIGEKHPYEANRIRSLLSSMFERAKEWGRVPENFTNPVELIKKFKEKKRDRWVKSEELPHLVDAILKEPNLYARTCLLLFLLVGSRKMELLKAKWENLDLERKILRLEDTKNGTDFELRLSDLAVALIQDLPKEPGNPYLFPGKKRGTHRVNIDKVWQKIRKDAKLDDVRIHDLRRTFASQLASDGISLLQIGKLLNHKNSVTTEVYAHLAPDPLAKVVDQHGNKIGKILGDRLTQNETHTKQERLENQEEGWDYVI